MSNEIVHVQSTMPSESEFGYIMRQAEVLANSNMVPSDFRGKPANIVVAALTGRTFGLDVMVAMRAITVIQGTPTLKPEFMLALIRRAGHTVHGETSNTGAWVEGKRSDSDVTMRVSFTEEDARAAGLLSKDIWKKYPAAMYWARAVSKLGRMMFSDVLLGAAYTKEEIGGDGQVIDVPEAEVIVHQPTPALTEEERASLYDFIGSTLEKLLDEYGEDTEAIKGKMAKAFGTRDYTTLSDRDLEKMWNQLRSYLAHVEEKYRKLEEEAKTMDTAADEDIWKVVDESREEVSQ